MRLDLSNCDMMTAAKYGHIGPALREFNPTRQTLRSQITNAKRNQSNPKPAAGKTAAVPAAKP